VTVENMSVLTRVHLLVGRFAELNARYTAEFTADRVKAQMTSEELRSVSADLERAREEADDLVIRSEADGVFIVPSAQDLPGRFLKKGDIVGYTLDLTTTTARVVVSQNDIDMVRQRTRSVEVRPADRIGDRLPAVIRRWAPAATDRLPSLALSRQGGGDIPLDLQDTRRPKAFQKFFMLDVDFQTGTATMNIGGRVHVRFDHGDQPLAGQWYRSIRQLFLSRFNV
jgi:putative peptide zinc metalloprotease protein